MMSRLKWCGGMALLITAFVVGVWGASYTGRCPPPGDYVCVYPNDARMAWAVLSPTRGWVAHEGYVGAEFRYMALEMRFVPSGWGRCDVRMATAAGDVPVHRFRTKQIGEVWRAAERPGWMAPAEWDDADAAHCVLRRVPDGWANAGPVLARLDRLLQYPAP